MLIGFSSHTRNGQAAIAYLTEGAVNYVTGERNSHGGRRSRSPEILRGDPKTTEALIRLVPHQHQYSSGMISFHPGDVINEAAIRNVMDEFEQTAFAGLERGRDYDVLWVKHTDANQTHLHWVTPRMCMHNRHYLNICPPGSRGVFDLLRTKLNLQHGWADPEDPHRAQSVRLPSYISRLRAKHAREGKPLKDDIREIAAKHVLSKAKEGLVKNRDDAVRVLKDAGLAVTRQGANYVTITHPETGKPVRLRGTLFDREHFSTVDRGSLPVLPGKTDIEKLRHVEHELQQIHLARERFNRERYRPSEAHPIRQTSEPNRKSNEDPKHEPTRKSSAWSTAAFDRRVDCALESLDGAIGSIGSAACGWGKAASELERGAVDVSRGSQSLECAGNQLGRAARELEPAVEQQQARCEQQRLDQDLVSRYGAMEPALAHQKRREQELEMERV